MTFRRRNKKKQLTHIGIHHLKRTKAPRFIDSGSSRWRRWRHGRSFVGVRKTTLVGYLFLLELKKMPAPRNDFAYGSANFPRSYSSRLNVLSLSSALHSEPSLPRRRRSAARKHAATLKPRWAGFGEKQKGRRAEAGKKGGKKEGKKRGLRGQPGQGPFSRESRRATGNRSTRGFEVARRCARSWLRRLISPRPFFILGSDDDDASCLSLT